MQRRELLKLLGLAPVAIAAGKAEIPAAKTAITSVTITNAGSGYSSLPKTTYQRYSGYGGGFHTVRND